MRFFTRLVLVLSMLSLGVVSMFAQGDRYVFSQSNGTYTEITGGTQIFSGAGIGSASMSANIAIPSFTFNGTGYTVMRVCGYGWVALNSTAAIVSSPLSSTTAGSAGAVISPLGRLLYGVDASSEVRWEQVGSEIVVQWKNLKTSTSATSYLTVNFQARLNTTTGAINFVYGNFGTSPTPPTFSYSGQVGIRGATTTFKTSVTNRTVPSSGIYWSDWSTTAHGTANSSTASFGYLSALYQNVTPGSGTTFTYTDSGASCPYPASTTVGTVTSTSVPITWSSTASALNGYEVRWRKYDDPATTATYSAPVSIPAGTTAYTITGLSSGFPHAIEVKSKCNTVNGQFSSVTAGTPTDNCGGAPTSPGSNVTAIDAATQRNITFTGVATADLGYETEYRLSTASTWTAGPTGPAGTGAQTILISGLSPATAYVVRIRSICSAGSSQWATTTPSFTTSDLCGGVPTTHTAPSGANLTQTTATLGWGAVAAATDGYNVRYRVMGQATWTTVTGITTNSYALTGLMPGTPYEWAVQTVCNGGATTSLNFGTTQSFATIPSNDFCSDAITLTCGTSIVGTSLNSTNDNMTPGTNVCGATQSTTGQNSAGVWFKYVGDGNEVTISSCPNGTTLTFDSRMALFSGDCTNLVCVAGNDDNNVCTAGTLTSSVTFNANVGTDYYLMLFGYSTTGNFQLTTSCVPLCTPAVTNDDPAAAQTLVVQTNNAGTMVSTNNTCSTPTLGVAYPSCASSFATYYDSWFQFNTGTFDNVYISADPKTFAGSAAYFGFIVYSGTPGAFTPVASSCFATTPMTAQLSKNITGLTAGTDYYVRLFSTSNAAKGVFEIKVEGPPTCFPPTIPASTNITATSADITFTCTACTEDVIVEYGPLGFTPGTGAMAGTNGTVVVATGAASPVALTGLTPNTNYDIYLRKDCSLTTTGISANTAPISFQTLPLCSGIPTAGNASATTTSAICSGTAQTFTLTGQTTGGGIAYQWQSSAAGSGMWTDIAGATGVSVSDSPTVSTDYRCKVECTASMQVDYTPTVTRNMLDLSTTTITLTGSAAPGYCVAASNTLSIPTGTLPVGGTYTYTWESNVSAAGWNPIAGATNATYNAAMNPNTEYRVVVAACTGATSATSAAFAGTPANCYCAPAYTIGCTDDDLIANVAVTGTTLSNNSGASCVAQYTFYPSSGGANFTANLNQGFTYNVVATVGNFGSQNIAAWIDYNDDLVFDDATERIGNSTAAIAANGTATFPISITATSNPGVHRMRIRDVYATAGASILPCASYSYGETEDYEITIILTPPCSGTPDVPVAAATVASVCPNGTSALSATGVSQGPTITYQWEEAPAGTTTWTPIAGANTTNYTATVTASTDYRLVTTCTASNLTSNSNVLTVNAATSIQCEYCSPFNGTPVVLHSFVGSPTIDRVIVNGIDNSTTTAPTNGYTEFPSTITTNLAQGSSYNATVNLGGTTGIVSLWIDFDQNKTFDATEHFQVYTSAASGAIAVPIPLTAVLGNTAMRVRARGVGSPNGATDACLSFGSGETEDYLVTIVAPIPAPANNDFVSAAPVSFSCATPTSGTTIGATSEITTAPNCDPSTTNDVWYTFNAADKLNVDMTLTRTGAMGTVEYALFKGAALNTLVQHSNVTTAGTQCGNTTTSVTANFVGLERNQNYYLRIWSNPNAEGTFDVCMTDATPPTVSVSAASANACVTAVTVNITGSQGNTNSWVPIMDGANLICEINANGNNLGNTTVSYYRNTGAVRQTPTGAYYMDRNIVIAPTTQPASDVNVRFYVTSGEWNALVAVVPTLTTSNFSMTRSTGGNANTCSGAFSNGASHVALNGATIVPFGTDYRIDFATPAFSQFYVNDAAAPLPVELKSFNGKVNGRVNTLRWETASQRNVSHFVVERSTSSSNNTWVKVARVAAAGNSTAALTYSADDITPMGLGYYRLAMVDNDGTTNYSNTITIERRSEKFGIVNITPNPTTDAVRVNFETVSKGEIAVVLSDITGRIVKTMNVTSQEGMNAINVEMSDLTVGAYFMTITDGVHRSIEKVIKH